MKLKLLSLTAIFFIAIFFVGNSFETAKSVESCKYEKYIEDCVNSGLDSRQFQDFLCIEGTREEKIYQVILDQRFREMDLEISQYLKDLEKNKNRFFGKESTQSILLGVDEIDIALRKGGFYYNKYLSQCGVSLIKEATTCNGGINSFLGTKDFFKTSTCEQLIETKLQIARDLAYDITKLNKSQVRKDELKRFQMDERSKYDEILDVMRINLGYIERIWKKWPSKIRNTL